MFNRLEFAARRRVAKDSSRDLDGLGGEALRTADRCRCGALVIRTMRRETCPKCGARLPIE